MEEHKIVRWYFANPGFEAECSCGWVGKRAPLNLSEDEAEEHGAVNAKPFKERQQ